MAAAMATTMVLGIPGEISRRTVSSITLIFRRLLRSSSVSIIRRRNLGLISIWCSFSLPLCHHSAVYLVAQYARHEMRKMDAELEKKKAEEEAKVKEMERLAEEEKEQRSVPELLEVKERLQALEETVKVIVVQTKKQPIGENIKNGEKTMEKEDSRRTFNDSLSASQKQQSPQLDKHKDGQKPGFHQGEKK